MLQGMRSAAKYIWFFVAATFLIGFVFYQQSGLGGRDVTPITTVAKVNGAAITYVEYQKALRDRNQQEQQRSGRTMNLDQERLVAEQVFNDLVTDKLLAEEYARRGIAVTDDEVRQALLEQPYPPIARSPEFQTDGRFDMQKYQRFLASPLARQEGIVLNLETYYRTALARSKLFEQIATSVYLTDAQLWRLWRDTRDSAQVTFVAFSADLIADSAVRVSDAEIAAYFEAHRKALSDVAGRAVLSIARLPRTIGAGDSAAARAKAEGLRAEIQQGAKFEDVARRESADTASAAQGGALGKAGRGAYVPSFAAALYSLRIGELSPPVLTQFGYHLIRVDARQGDSVTAHHILVRIQQGDSAATRTDRLADALSKASGATPPAVFDSVVKGLGLEIGQVSVTEGAAALLHGQYVPGASSWAFDGATPGEIGELIDADDAYYLLRLDSLTPGRKPTLDAMREEIRKLLAREKKLDRLLPRGQQLTAAAAGGTSLETAAATLGYVPVTSAFFARTSQVPGLDQGTEAIGAAFGLPVGVVGPPVKARTSVVVERVNVRHVADSALWEKQKPLQRDQMQQRMREATVQQYMAGLRQDAKIVDNRKKIQADARRQPTS